MLLLNKAEWDPRAGTEVKISMRFHCLLLSRGSTRRVSHQPDSSEVLAKLRSLRSFGRRDLAVVFSGWGDLVL